MIIARELGLRRKSWTGCELRRCLHDVWQDRRGGPRNEEARSAHPRFDLMKQHTLKGAKIMRPVSQLKEMLPASSCTMSTMVWGGYPYGLRRSKDPQGAIIASPDPRWTAK